MATRIAAPFDSLPKHTQRVILIRFLGEYGKWEFQKREEMLYIVKHNGYEYTMPYQQVCEKACDMLHYEGRFADKFRILVSWMKTRHLSFMYEGALNEKFEDALK